MLKFGYAEADITPDVPLELIGFNREDNTSRGILKSLYAQVSVWESENCCCLITIDSIGFKTELANILRMEVADKLSVSCDKVMLCFSHCHSAPNADEHSEYFNMVCKKVLSSVDEAIRHMNSVVAGWDKCCRFQCSQKESF